MCQSKGLVAGLLSLGNLCGSSSSFDPFSEPLHDGCLTFFERSQIGVGCFFKCFGALLVCMGAGVVGFDQFYSFLWVIRDGIRNDQSFGESPEVLGCVVIFIKVVILSVGGNVSIDPSLSDPSAFFVLSFDRFVVVLILIPLIEINLLIDLSEFLLSPFPFVFSEDILLYRLFLAREVICCIFSGFFAFFKLISFPASGVQIGVLFIGEGRLQRPFLILK